MIRAYDVNIEIGERVYAKEYVVMAGTAEQAIKKAKKMAVNETGRKTGWRITHLHEWQSQAIA